MNDREGAALRGNSDAAQALPLALSVIDEIGAELSANPFFHQGHDRRLTRIPLPSEANAARRGALARGWLQTIATVDVAALPDEVALSLAVAKATARRLADEEDWYWLVHDPLGLGFFGLFGPTAYAGGWYLNTLVQVLGRFAFQEPGDLDRYMGLAADLVGVLVEMRVRLVGQAARGIRMPKVQIAQARVLMSGLATRVAEGTIVAAARTRHLSGCEAFDRRLRAVVNDEVAPALTALAALLDDDYAARAPDAVGMAQYPRGEAIYAALVRHHTTLDLDPAGAHAIGLERLTTIRASMAQIQSEVGFRGDDLAYHATVGADPGYRARDVGDVEAMFRRKIGQARDHLDDWFRFRPQAPFDVEALPEALSGAMTFGFYQTSTSPTDPGLYRFNGPNMVRSGLANVATLTFHELVPGHHIHLSSQAENRTLPPLRRYNAFNAFNEGWAEYAAGLAGEDGLYETPQERFGRLTMDAFLTCRLVVDTGMNTLGWSLERAREFLRLNAFMGDREIETESIRYACDTPAQALAYKLGDTFLLGERERMRAALGPAFDIRDFHDAVLRPGAVPLPLVTGQIDRAIQRLTPKVSASLQN